MPENVFPPSLKLHYVKGNFFRVIHADGAIGGLTPTREIFISLFSERAAIPQIIEMEVTPDGTLGHEISREGKEGIVRELEIGVTLTARAAEAIANMLLQHVRAIHESSRIMENEPTREQ
jgi:hypothetical protein